MKDEEALEVVMTGVRLAKIGHATLCTVNLEALSQVLRSYEGMREALTKIAAYDDVQASAWLGKTGSTSMFDEPGSVMIARQALQSGAL